MTCRAVERVKSGRLSGATLSPPVPPRTDQRGLPSDGNQAAGKPRQPEGRDVTNFYDVVWAAGIALAALVYIALVALGAWWLGTRDD